MRLHSYEEVRQELQAAERVLLSVCLSVCMSVYLSVCRHAYARAVGFKLRSLLLTACRDFIFIRALKFVSFWGEGFWF